MYFFCFLFVKLLISEKIPKIKFDIKKNTVNLHTQKNNNVKKRYTKTESK